MKKSLLSAILVVFSFTSQAQWQVTSGPSGAGHISSLTVKDSTVFAGTETGGVFVSTDQGNTWTVSNNGLTNLNDVKALIADSTYVFAGLGNSLGGPAVFSTIDDGATWNPTPLSFIFFWSFAMRPGYLVAGTWSGVSVSVNNGTTWNSFSAGLPSNASVAALAYSGTKLFAGVSSSSTGGTGAFYSNNNGSSWNAFNTGITTSTIVNKLAVLGSYVFAGTPAGVFRSATATAGWSAMNTGLTNTTIRSFLTVGNDLFTGTAAGVFYTSNSGTSWSDISTGLPVIRNIYSLAADNMYIYAGTDSAVYRRPLSEVVSGFEEPDPAHVTINIFPNPVITGFALVIKNEHATEMNIYNLVGEKVLHCPLHRENQKVIDVSSFPAGIYFVTVTDDERRSVTKKIVKM